ncbi:MAG: endo-1,4-beta-xylanase [Pseudomonadota bacterium]
MARDLRLCSILGVALVAACSSGAEKRADGSPNSAGAAPAPSSAGSPSGGSGGARPASPSSAGGGGLSAGTGGLSAATSGGAAGAAQTGTGGQSAAGAGGFDAGGQGGGNAAGAPGAGGQAGSAGATSGAGAGGASTGVLKKYIGNISSKNKDIQTDFADRWQQVTMEANSKWGFVQPNGPDDWVWDPVDKVYQYALDHQIVFKGHCFFWATEQPSWVTASNVMTVAPAWIKAFCDRYPKTAMIDVVNEPGHNPAPYRAGMGGAGKTGFDWVLQGFQWAREYCPGRILLINDFNIIEYDNDNSAFISMLQKLLDAGAPIDAIGAQGHDVYKIGAAKAKTYLDKLASTFHLPIYITEMDIDQANDMQQAQLMQDEITMFWNHPSVQGITYWGYVRGTTWRSNAWLVDTNGKDRPAMTWLQNFIEMNP